MSRDVNDLRPPTRVDVELPPRTEPTRVYLVACGWCSQCHGIHEEIPTDLRKAEETMSRAREHAGKCPKDPNLLALRNAEAHLRLLHGQPFSLRNYSALLGKVLSAERRVLTASACGFAFGLLAMPLRAFAVEFLHGAWFRWFGWSS